MTRMRTIMAMLADSVTGKLQRGTHSEKSKKLSRSEQVKRCNVFSAIALLLCVMLSGCAGKFEGIATVVVDDHHWKEGQLDNACFELMPTGNSPVLQPGVDFWLKHGDQVAIKWDTFEFHWEHNEVMCSFENNTSTSDCSICDYCQNPVGQNGPPCFGFELRNIGSPFHIVAMHEGFIFNPNPNIALAIDSQQIPDGCPNSPNRVAFSPEMSATYQIIFPKTDYSTDPTPFDVQAETKIHVIKTGISRTAAYQLMPETVDGTDFWTWRVTGDNRWLENFSPNLRVTGIRILKGKCESDPSLGRECVAPDNDKYVKPSRVFFLPNFRGTVSNHVSESTHVCHENPNAVDGYYIRLTDLNTQTSDDCRTRNDVNPPIIDKSVTPTYEVSPENPLDKLTWLIEFNINEGADADLMMPGNQTMSPNAELIIEFIIEAF